MVVMRVFNLCVTANFFRDGEANMAVVTVNGNWGNEALGRLDVANVGGNREVNLSEVREDEVNV